MSLERFGGQVVGRLNYLSLKIYYPAYFEEYFQFLFFFFMPFDVFLKYYKTGILIVVTMKLGNSCWQISMNLP